MRQNPTHVNNPPRELVTTDKIKPLSSQKVRPESGKLGVTWFRGFIMRYEMKKC